MSNRYKYILTATAIAASVALAGTALAATAPQGHGSFGGQFGAGRPQGAPGGMTGALPAVVGNVSSINGEILTITSHARNQDATTTYSVDATNAKIFKLKGNATSTLSAISTGDMVVVEGTVNGTNVTATIIRDGLSTNNWSGSRGPRRMPPQQGPIIRLPDNGQPVVTGNITSTNGDSISISNRENVTYTVDATNANIQERGIGTTTVSSLKTGDSLIVQGVVNGTSVTASTVVDNGVLPAPGNASSTEGRGPAGFVGGLVSKIGGFFSHIFKF